MSWTYQQVKAADAALVGAPLSPDAAAVALNAQTTSSTVPFSWSVAKRITQISGSWSKIVLRSRLSDGSAANLAAINAYEMPNDRIFDPSVTSAMTTLSSGLAALLTSGDMTSADVSAIQALAGASSVPMWQPAITAGDVQTARNQP